MVTINAGLAALIAVLPSAVIGFCFWLIERRIQKHDEAEKIEREKRQKALDEREALRQQNEYMTLKSVSAAVELAEATARAVQRIPDAKCNGDMHAALDYAEQVKKEQNEFLAKQSLRTIYAN